MLLKWLPANGMSYDPPEPYNACLEGQNLVAEYLHRVSHRQERSKTMTGSNLVLATPVHSRSADEG